MFRRIFACLPVIALAACGRDSQPVLARVDAAPITAADLSREIQNVPAGAGDYLNTLPGKKELLELLIRRRVVLAEAQRSAAADSPELKKKLAELDEDFMRQRQDARERLLVADFLKDMRDGPLKISDEEVKKAWAEGKEARASHILLADEAKAREVRARLDKGDSFESLAREYSQDPKGKQGGDLGYFMHGSFGPSMKDFEDAIFALKTGDVAGPLSSPYGYHIVKKTGERPLSTRPLDEIEKPIRVMLETQRFQTWLEDAKKRHAVAVDASALEKASPALPKAQQ